MTIFRLKFKKSVKSCLITLLTVINSKSGREWLIKMGNTNILTRHNRIRKYICMHACMYEVSITTIFFFKFLLTSSSFWSAVKHAVHGCRTKSKIVIILNNRRSREQLQMLKFINQIHQEIFINVFPLWLSMYGMKWMKLSYLFFSLYIRHLKGFIIWLVVFNFQV